MRNDMEIQRVPIAQLKPYPGTPRIHNRQKRRKLASLLRRFGQALPVLIDEAYQIIDGHAVVDALKELGAEDAAVIIARNWSLTEIRALRLAVNRTFQSRVDRL
jgi:ParB-like chromosome segregation protein Spo0J